MNTNAFWRLAGMAAIGLASVSPQAAALTVAMDEFLVLRDGATYFQDGFDDGLVPPTVPAATLGGLTYAVFGTAGMVMESGGLLTVEAALGGATTNAIAQSRLAVTATLVSSASEDPAFVANGLRQHRDVTVRGVFLYTAPAGGDSYGIRLGDFASPVDQRDDVVSLLINGTPGGPRVSFLLQDFKNGVQPVLESADFLTLAGASAFDRVELVLHKPADSAAVSASFNLLAGSVPVAGAVFTATQDIFHGETYTRAGYLVAQVPEPHTYLMLLAGMGLVGVVVRRRLA